MQLLKIETTTHGCVGMAHSLQQWPKWLLVSKYTYEMFWNWIMALLSFIYFKHSFKTLMILLPVFSFKVILLEMLVANLIAMPYTFHCRFEWNSSINFFVSSFLILVSLYKNRNHRDNVAKSKQEDLRIEQNWDLRIRLRCVVHHNEIKKTTWILPQKLKSSITKSKNNI
jgi:hypothetical protein